MSPPRRTRTMRAWTSGRESTGRVAQLYRRELARFEREHPRCLELRERARPVMPHGVPMQWMAASFAHPVWVDRGPRRPLHLRRRARLPRHQHRRQEHLLRLRPRAGRARRAGARRRRTAVHAPDRGRDRRRRGARTALGAPLLAVHPVGEPGEHGGAAPGAPRHRARARAHVHRRLRGARGRVLRAVRGGRAPLVLRAEGGRGARRRRRAVQRRRGARARARDRRLRLRAHRAGAHELGRRAARPGVPRRPPSPLARASARC